jgi:hypothetical protein
MPETTVMRKSIVGDAWIQEMCRLNPVQRVVDDKGVPTGNILSGPVRLSFCDSLLEAAPMMKSDPKSRVGHSSAVLFTPYTDFTIFWEEYYRICASDFAGNWDQGSQQYLGLDNPIIDQGMKAKYDGYTPGLMMMNTSSQYKPPIVDWQNMPVTDASKVHAGAWAIMSLNAYASGKGQPRKGPRFGLQTVMIVGDDTNLGGGAPDPRAQFKGVNVKPPVAVPSAAFGAGAPMGVPPPHTAGPGAIAAFYAPGAPQAPPGSFQPAGRALPPPPLGVPADDDWKQFT